ncbi:hypothetical protein [Serratia marcescens]|uniref:transcriptional antitermination N peptide n=1 Tax=Serratia marcescens TaxID=615 RepID=UPI00202A39B0|nr:hypothetical protein [Serratia marcescens]
MNSKERKKLARAIAHRAERNKDISLARNVASALVGNARVAKALALAEYGSNHEPHSCSACLPEVALFMAGHRKTNRITAR